MNGRGDELKQRTRAFAVRVLRFADSLGSSAGARAIANQIARSGTSVAANCRAACRSRSKREFLAKLGPVEEEADETAFWIELAIEAGLTTAREAAALLREAEELTAIMVASIKTTRATL